MNTLFAIKGSIIAGMVVVALDLFSMGALGLGLYYLTYPIHYPLLGDINQWEGVDLFWPTIIWAGMLWAICFPAAGLVDLRLQRAGTARARRIFSYLVILWLGAGFVWLFVAMTSGYRFPASGI
jgi:hypothetical protein